MPSIKEIIDTIINAKSWEGFAVIVISIIGLVIFKYKSIKKSAIENSRELWNDYMGLKPWSKVVWGYIVVILFLILGYVFYQRIKPNPYQEIALLNNQNEVVYPIGVDIFNEAQVGDYVFFRYKVKEKIGDDEFEYLALYRWKKGELAERISERACPHFEVARNSIIYLDSTLGDLSHGQLYVARPDGTRERVIEEELYDFSVEHDYIYYVYCYDTVGVGLEGHALHRMDINGDNIITVAYEVSGPDLRGDKYSFRIEDGWAIYSNYKIKTDKQADGLEKVVLLESIKEEWIYYTSNKLIKARPDGTEQVVLDDEDDFWYKIIKIEDGWIYYYKGEDMYKIDINGNNKEMIEYY